MILILETLKKSSNLLQSFNLFFFLFFGKNHSLQIFIKITNKVNKLGVELKLLNTETKN